MFSPTRTIARTILLALPICLQAACTPTPAKYSPTTMVEAGNGSYVKAECPEGMYVRALQAKLEPNAWITKLRAYCHRWTGAQFSSLNEVIIEIGPGGGTPVTLTAGGCSHSAAAVHSAVVGADVVPGHIRRLDMMCWNNLVADGPSWTVGVTPGGQTLGPVACPTTKLVSGIQGREDPASGIVAFGLLCAPKP